MIDNNSNNNDNEIVLDPNKVLSPDSQDIILDPSKVIQPKSFTDTLGTIWDSLVAVGEQAATETVKDVAIRTGERLGEGDTPTMATLGAVGDIATETALDGITRTYAGSKTAETEAYSMMHGMWGEFFEPSDRQVEDVLTPRRLRTGGYDRPELLDYTYEDKQLVKDAIRSGDTSVLDNPLFAPVKDNLLELFDSQRKADIAKSLAGKYRGRAQEQSDKIFEQYPLTEEGIVPELSKVASLGIGPLVATKLTKGIKQIQAANKEVKQFKAPDPDATVITKVGEDIMEAPAPSAGVQSRVVVSPDASTIASKGRTIPDPQSPVKSTRVVQGDSKFTTELDKNLITFESLPDPVKVSTKELMRDVYLGTSLSAGPGNYGSFLTEDEDSPFSRRVLLGLETMLGIGLFSGTGNASLKYSSNLYSPTSKNRLDVPSFDAGVDEYYDNVLAPIMNERFIENEFGGYDLKSIRTAEGALGLKIPLPNMMGIRSSVTEMHDFMEVMERQRVKHFNNPTGSSLDTLEYGTHRPTIRIRRAKAGMSSYLLDGDGQDLMDAGVYFNESGRLAKKPGVPSLAGIKRTALEQGATLDESTLFETALDAADNYRNILADVAGHLDEVDGLLRKADVTVEPDLWTKFMNRLTRGEDSVLSVDAKNATRFEEVNLEANLLAGQIIDSLPESIAAQVEDKLVDVLDQASKRAAMSKAEADRIVDDALTNTTWAKQQMESTAVLNNHILEQLTDTGVITKSTAEEWRKKHPNYLPNYKKSQVLGFEDDSYSRKPSTYNPSQLQSLKNRNISPKQQVNGLVARREYIMKTSNVIAEAAARRQILNWMTSWGEQDFDFFTFAKKADVEAAIDDLAAGRKSHVTVEDLAGQYIDPEYLKNNLPRTTFHINGGKLELPLKHKLLHDIVQNANVHSKTSNDLPFGFRQYSKIVQLARDAIVRNPSFAANTWFKEVSDKLINSNAPVHRRLQFLKSAQALAAKERDPDLWNEFTLNAGFYGNKGYLERGMSEEEIVESFLRSIKGDKFTDAKTLDDKVEWAKQKFLDQSDGLLRRVDFAPRIAYYKEMRKMGHTHDAAMDLALDLGVNFTQRGLDQSGFMNYMELFVPFSRVTVNSIDRLGRRLWFERKKAATGIATAGLIEYFTNVTGLVETSEEGEVSPAQERKVFQADVGEGLVGLPKGFLSSVGYATSKLVGKVASDLDRYTQSALADNIEATFGKKVADKMFNNPATTRRILAEYGEWALTQVPRVSLIGGSSIWAMATNELPGGIPYQSPDIASREALSQRYTDRTSPSIIKATEILASETGIEVSPMAVELVFNNTFPEIAEMGFWLTDLAMAKTGLIPDMPAQQTSDIPGIHRFFTPKDHKAIEHRYWNLYGAVKEATGMVESYKMDAKDAQGKYDAHKLDMFSRLTDENREYVDVFNVMSKYQENIKTINKQITDEMWDRNPLYSTEDRQAFGSDTKYARLKYLREQKANVMKTAIDEVMELPYGPQMVAAHSIPYSSFVQFFNNKMKVTERDSTATYNEKYDDLFIETDPNTGELLQLEPMSYEQEWDFPINVQDTIVQTANEQGVNAGTLLAIAQIESKMGVNTENAASNATGVFQIMPKTWKNLVSKGFGDEYGITKDMIDDPIANIRMGVLLHKEDVSRASNVLGRNLNLAEQYSLHLMGLGQGVEYLEAKFTSPNMSIKDVVSSAAYKSNPNLFKGENNKPLTVRQVHNKLVGKVNEALQQLDLSVEEDVKEE